MAKFTLALTGILLIAASLITLNASGNATSLNVDKEGKSRVTKPLKKNHHQMLRIEGNEVVQF